MISKCPSLFWTHPHSYFDILKQALSLKNIQIVSRAILCLSQSISGS